VGATGIRALRQYLPDLKRDLQLDFAVANGENALDGYGPSPDTCEQLFGAGIDVVTSGNHIWDNAGIIPFAAREPRLLRPHNYPGMVPGTGVGVYSAATGGRVCVINLMARTFMEPLDDPFAVYGAAVGHPISQDAEQPEAFLSAHGSSFALGPGAASLADCQMPSAYRVGRSVASRGASDGLHDVEDAYARSQSRIDVATWEVGRP